MVGLTFDDGPDPEATPALLDRLAAHHARATFFVLADRAAAHPELVRAVVDAGHEVGLHGLDHRRLTAVPRDQVEPWLRAGRERLERIAGVPIRRFRPPFGALTPTTLRSVRRAGLEPVVWQADAGDWLAGDPAEPAERALARLRPGGVLLLHERLDDRPDAPAGGPGDPAWHVAVAEHVLRGLDQRGLRATSVGSALAAHPPERTVWFR